MHAVGGNQRLDVELTIGWSLTNKQTVLALMDTGAECTLVYGGPSKFQKEIKAIGDYGGQIIKVIQTLLYLDGQASFLLFFSAYFPHS